jgi:DNA-directed RNA polymerase subunit A"
MDFNVNYASMTLSIEIDEEQIEEKRLDYDEIIKKIEKAFKKVEINKNLLSFEPTISEAKHAIRELRLLADKVRDLQISGIKNIGKVVIRKEGQEWVIHTEGSNLGAILKMEGVDKTRTTTNDIHEVEKILGIEAARNAIIREAQATMEEQGLTVDVRHIMLVADMMTADGTVKSIGRHGISGEKASVLARASFEETGKHLLRASIRGEVDHLTGIIENIIIGQPLPLGTGSVGVIMKQRE